MNYTGQRYDDTGLLFYNARYYDPAIGRFISADTIVPGSGPLTVSPSDAVAQEMWAKRGGGTANPQELNRYSYGLNNPVKYTDPTGHCIFGLDTIVCVAFVGAVLVGGSLIAVSSSPNSGMRWGDYDWTNWSIPGFAAETGSSDSKAQGPFEKAKSGGTHSGTYKQYKDKPEKQLRKALGSYEDNVAEHAEKLADPRNAGTDTPWDEMDPREQQGLLKKWAGDLVRNREFAEIMRGILKERGLEP